MNRIYITYQQIQAYGRVMRIMKDFIPEIDYRIERDDIGGFFIKLWMIREEE